jgi:hypothetical protein
MMVEKRRTGCVDKEEPKAFLDWLFNDMPGAIIKTPPHMVGFTVKLEDPMKIFRYFHGDDYKKVETPIIDMKERTKLTLTKINHSYKTNARN